MHPCDLRRRRKVKEGFDQQETLLRAGAQKKAPVIVTISETMGIQDVPPTCNLLSPDARFEVTTEKPFVFASVQLLGGYAGPCGICPSPKQSSPFGMGET
ncbi:unnamed protein product [Schistocephalus solidus]|uniref:3-isopropylmalate dehydratase large subunit n=1 Tax=Schistocephalus solidus TaxID=70667 RepID=A0A183TEW6_SCHSO|nr:unnamed protein product [Schistocephalus solidus]